MASDAPWSSKTKQLAGSSLSLKRKSAPQDIYNLETDAQGCSSEDDVGTARQESVCKLLQQWSKPEGYNEFQRVMAKVDKEYRTCSVYTATDYEEAMVIRFGAHWKAFLPGTDPSVEAARQTARHEEVVKLIEELDSPCDFWDFQKLMGKVQKSTKEALTCNKHTYEYAMSARFGENWSLCG